MNNKPLDISKEDASSSTETQNLSSENLQMSGKEDNQFPTYNSVQMYVMEFSKQLEKDEVTAAQEHVKTGLTSQSSKDKNPESRDMTSGIRDGIKRRLSEGPSMNSGAKQHTDIDFASDAKIKDKAGMHVDPTCSEGAIVYSRSLRSSDTAANKYAKTPHWASLSSSLSTNLDEEKMIPDLDHYKSADRVYINGEPSRRVGASGNNDYASVQESSRNHNQGLPYECAQCSDSFSECQSLKTHLKIHKKPYICKVCEREFVHQHYLMKHFKFH